MFEIIINRVIAKINEANINHNPCIIAVITSQNLFFECPIS